MHDALGSHGDLTSHCCLVRFRGRVPDRGEMPLEAYRSSKPVVVGSSPAIPEKILPPWDVDSRLRSAMYRFDSYRESQFMAALRDADLGLRNPMDQFDSDSGCQFRK